MQEKQGINSWEYHLLEQQVVDKDHTEERPVIVQLLLRVGSTGVLEVRTLIKWAIDKVSSINHMILIQKSKV